MARAKPALTDIAIECSIANYVDYQRICVDANGHTFRVTVHSDSSYPNQSRGTVELWGWSRWEFVHTVDPMAHRPVWQALCAYLPPHRHGEVRVEAEKFAAQLLAIALEIVGPGER